LAAETLALPIALGSAMNRNPEELIAAHHQMVLRTAYRLLGSLDDAQDAAQEVFLRVLKHQCAIGAEPKAWLYRVTVNVCNDHYRRAKRTSAELTGETADSAPDPEKIFSLKERRRLLLEGIDRLSPRERTCIVLRDIEGISTAEVAQILDIEETTVRGQIHTARLKLAKYVRRVR
jgi:RNA polymerase sigma-70 factor, ECF subfamily